LLFHQAINMNSNTVSGQPSNVFPRSSPPPASSGQVDPAATGRQGAQPVSPFDDAFKHGLRALMTRNGNPASPGTPGASPSSPAFGSPSAFSPRVNSRQQRQTMPPLYFNQGSPLANGVGVNTAIGHPARGTGSSGGANTGGGALAFVPPPHDQPPPIPADLPPPVSYAIGQTPPFSSPASLPPPTDEVPPPPAPVSRGKPADGSDSPVTSNSLSGEDVSHSGSTGNVPAPRAENATGPGSWAQPVSRQASRGKQAQFLALRQRGADSPKGTPVDAGMGSPPVLSPRGRVVFSGEDSSSSGAASTRSVSDGSPKPTVSLSTSVSAASITEESGPTQAALPSGWSTIQTMPDVHDYKGFVVLLTRVIEDRLPRNAKGRCILSEEIAETAGRGEFRVVPENYAKLDEQQVGVYEHLLASDQKILRALIAGYSADAVVPENGKRKSWGKITRVLDGKKMSSEPVSPRQQNEDVLGDQKLPAIKSAVVPRSVNLGKKNQSASDQPDRAHRRNPAP
jgi:hypothetical protein